MQYYKKLMIFVLLVLAACAPGRPPTFDLTNPDVLDSLQTCKNELFTAMAAPIIARNDSIRQAHNCHVIDWVDLDFLQMLRFWDNTLGDDHYYCYTCKKHFTIKDTDIYIDCVEIKCEGELYFIPKDWIR